MSKKLVEKKKPVVDQEYIDKKHEQAINLLNDIVRVKIGKSDIDGVGVIAMRDINKNSKLELDSVPHMFDVPYSKFDKIKKDVRDILLGHFPLIVEGSHFMYPVTKFTAYLNHSDDANYDAVKDKTLRKIKAGEEITEDYRKIKNYNEIFKFII